MSSVVYPVRGGMEDWAYGGSWEGYPIITPCVPTTYPDDKTYPKSRTDYSKRPDAVKSIMFLLEASNDKHPKDELLGKEHHNCLVNIRQNAFFNKVITDKACLDKAVDGYVPRILRLSLSLIDLLEPYINFKASLTANSRSIHIKWIVGGALEVNNSLVLYDYVSVSKAKKIEKQIVKMKDNADVLKLFRHKTKPVKGNGIWGFSFTKKDNFNTDIKYPSTERKILLFIIIAEVDKNWGNKIKADPLLNPQTHVVNLRINPNYTAKNGKFSLRGQKYFKSDLGIVEIKNKKANVRRVNKNYY